MMKSATISELKRELNNYSSEELRMLCLNLAKFKKDNKELLTYLMFEAADEDAYVEQIKQKVSEQLQAINTKNYHWMRKGVRKVLKEVKKYIRYSPKKETEVELLIDFCDQLTRMSPSIRHDKTLQNLFDRQLALARSKIERLHEDLQYDFHQKLERLEEE